jgi:hypothetical protein
MIVMQRIAHWYEHRHDEMIAVSLLPSVHSHVYCQRCVRLPLGAALLHCARQGVNGRCTEMDEGYKCEVDLGC